MMEEVEDGVHLFPHNKSRLAGGRAAAVEGTPSLLLPLGRRLEEEDALPVAPALSRGGT